MTASGVCPGDGHERPAVLLAGAPPGEAAGLPVGGSVLLAALETFASVGLLAHEMSLLPSYRELRSNGTSHIALGTQPIAVHAEAALAGWLHRRRLSRWACGWAVGSRYASAFRTAGLRYIVWEATTLRDELAATGVREVRRSGRGTGVGAVIHRTLLPLNDVLERALYRNAAAVLGMSEYSRALILRRSGIAPDRVRVLSPPPAPALLSALAALRQRGVTRSVTGSEPLRLLVVGRLDDPRKNFALVLKAYRALRESGCAVTLTAIGPHTAQWRASVGGDTVAEEIQFLGRVGVSDLASAYLSHDVLIVSSRQEGYGFTVAEAFHAGLPVVSTKCGGPEHLITESKGGLLTDHDAAHLAAAVRELLSSPERRLAMGAAARRYAENSLSPDHFARCVRDITLAALVRTPLRSRSSQS